MCFYPMPTVIVGLCRVFWQPLLTFTFHGVLGGITLYIFRGFYIGPASLETSPPLGVPFVRKRVQALLHVM